MRTLRRDAAAGRPGGPAGVDVPRDAGALRAVGAALAARGVRGAARPRPGPPAITSVAADRAGPERLLAWNRGHWKVENGNHFRRDATMGEDAARFGARHAPANHAALDDIALAVVFRNGFRHLPEANRHCMVCRADALDAVLSPG